MGSSCCSSKLTYQHDGKLHQIPVKDAITIDRYAQGANARIQTQNLKKNYAKEIADLKVSDYDLNETLQPLMANEEFDKYIDSRNKQNKCFNWNNQFQPVNPDGTPVFKINPKTFEASQEETEKLRTKSISKQQVLESKGKAVKQEGELAKWRAVEKGEVFDYRGEWNRDRSKWEGIGQIKFPDGSFYQGVTQNQKPQGKGRMTYPDGNIYQGEWNQGKAHGEGTFVKKGTSVYIGQWKNDKQHGKGKEMWESGAIVYSGDFLEGEKTGKARFEAQGNIYEGDFVKGQFHGKGKYYFGNDGRIYDGEFFQNEMQGKGILIWNDGTKYEGEFKQGKMQGSGLMILPNKDKYVGQFNNDSFHGVGVWHSHADKTKRQGEWKEGKRLSWLNQASPSYELSDQLPSEQAKIFKDSELIQNKYRGGKWRMDINEKEGQKNWQEAFQKKYNLPRSTYKKADPAKSQKSAIGAQSEDLRQSAAQVISPIKKF